MLYPEKGIVDGLKPVFLNGWDTDNVRYVRLNSWFKPFSFNIPARNNFSLEQGDNYIRRVLPEFTSLIYLFSVEVHLSLEHNSVCAASFVGYIVLHDSSFRHYCPRRASSRKASRAGGTNWFDHVGDDSLLLDYCVSLNLL
jgi:hypothetical protein